MEVPPQARRLWRRCAIAVGIVLVVVVHVLAIRSTGFSLTQLAKGLSGIYHFVSGALPPHLGWTRYLKPGLGYCLTTIYIGLLGTTLSIPFALVFAILGSRNTSRNVVVYQVARGIMSFLRSVPSLVWALVFVTAVGLGNFPGVLALLVHNVGVMGKLWSEAMEEVDSGPVDALHVAGASGLQTATNAVLPSVIPQFVSLLLYRLDVNIRESVVLGIVGAGGIGFYLLQSVDNFQFKETMTYVLMIIVIVIVVDQVSAYVRKRLAA